MYVYLLKLELWASLYHLTPLFVNMAICCCVSSNLLLDPSLSTVKQQPVPVLPLVDQLT